MAKMWGYSLIIQWLAQKIVWRKGWAVAGAISSRLAVNKN
jgi:hypothetical protein